MNLYVLSICGHAKTGGHDFMNNVPVRIAKNPDIKGGTPPIGKSLHDRWILVFTRDSGFNAGFWL